MTVSTPAYPTDRTTAASHPSRMVRDLLAGNTEGWPRPKIAVARSRARRDGLI